MASAAYPVHVQARLDAPLSRWLWLVKWVLAIPHYLVLAVLWLAFLVTSIAAFLAILVTGSYPRALFDFNVGVLRWSWRVNYYTYGALGTDRYPPFTLTDVPDYPARLSVDRPARLSRGLVLVKWWLLALPHYVVLGFFVGGGVWLAGRADDRDWGGGGLIGVLVLVAAVVLAVTGGYPRPLFDFILGMQRWVLRVGGYAALMTDVYPPFRLDLGGQDPDGVLTFAGGDPPAPPADAPLRAEAPVADPAGSPVPGPSGAFPQSAHRTRSGGQIVSVVVGAVLAVGAVGPLVAGGVLLWADRTQRDSAGFLTSPAAAASTDTRALVSQTITIRQDGPDWARSVIGDARMRFTSQASDRAVFVGIASARDAAGYLAGTQYATVTDLAGGRLTSVRHAGGAPAALPASGDIWVARATGPGTQTLTWTPQAGDWTIVVMYADAGPGVAVQADAGATTPALPWIAVALLLAGAVLLSVGVTCIVVPLAGSGPGDLRPPTTAPQPRQATRPPHPAGPEPAPGAAPGAAPRTQKDSEPGAPSS